MDGSAEDDSSDTLPPGTVLGRYEIRRLLGRGGMGCVYEGVHLDLKKRVAIKTLLPTLASSGDARQRFLREGEAASRIRHPHVVDVTDVGSQGTVIYLVMEYLEGEDLARLIARQGYLSVTQAADIMLPVAAAIATAHEQGVIHRDLKPENIFLARTGYGGPQPKVLDFGISKVLGDSRARALTGTAATMGTMNYLPPEQLRAAREADARSDQYGLGTILYECVTGQRAFDEESFYIVLKKIAEGEFRSPSSRRPDLPPRMEAIILRAMSLEPLDRFQSVKELGAALLDLASDGVRSMWTPFFGAAPDLDTPPPRVNTDNRARVATLLEPTAESSSSSSSRSSSSASRSSPSSPPSGATLELPAPRRSASTTMRNATGERSRITLSPPRRSRAPMMIAGVALVAGLAALFVLRGTAGPPTQRFEPESAAVESPPPRQPPPIPREPPPSELSAAGQATAPTALPERAAPKRDTETATEADKTEKATTPATARKLGKGGARGIRASTTATPTSIARKGGRKKAPPPQGEPEPAESGAALPNNAPIIP